MILISKIEYSEIEPDDHVTVDRYSDRYITSEPTPKDLAPNIETETIRGTRFVRPSDGTDIVIGCSGEAAELIGIQYEAWDNLKKDLAYSDYMIKGLQAEIKKIKSAPFFTRLKWAFFGYK